MLRLIRGVLGGSLLAWLVLLVLLSPSALAQPADGKVTVQMVNYNQLGQIIRGFKGKVVVVDFWADF
jgi:hypothetical protein